MSELNVKHYAHIGDAYWELYIRNKTIYATGNLNKLHSVTVALVNAAYQTEILEFLQPYLTEQELQLAKRGGNIKTGRRTNRNLHRTATELEVLFGYLYLSNQERLKELEKITDEKINRKISEMMKVL